jgi:hypothetical protein
MLAKSAPENPGVPLDLETYRDAWQAGVEWAENNSYKQGQQTGQKLTQDTSTNFESAIPSTPKRDSSIQLPSQA